MFSKITARYCRSSNRTNFVISDSDFGTYEYQAPGNENSKRGELKVLVHIYERSNLPVIPNILEWYLQYNSDTLTLFWMKSDAEHLGKAYSDKYLDSLLRAYRVYQTFK